jgi:hypothetical protein
VSRILVSPPLTVREGLCRLLRRHIPHKTRSGCSWCRPVWFAYLFGGTFDTGNGYGWRPNLYLHIQRYYVENWREAGETLWSWLGLTERKRNSGIKKHGLW